MPLIFVKEGKLFMLKNLALVSLFAIGFIVSSESYGENNYNNSFNNNSGTINIYNSGNQTGVGGGGGYRYGNIGYYYVPVTPTYYYYTVPTTTYYYTTTPLIIGGYGHTTIRYRGRW
jgi:hypothetical protein